MKHLTPLAKQEMSRITSLIGNDEQGTNVWLHSTNCMELFFYILLKNRLMWLP
jgi:hypothetical protein